MYKCFQTCLKFQPDVFIGPLVLDALLNIPDGEIARQVDEVFRCRDYRSTCPMCLWFGFTRCRYPDCSAQRERERHDSFVAFECVDVTVSDFYGSFVWTWFFSTSCTSCDWPPIVCVLNLWHLRPCCLVRCVMGSMLWLVQNVSSGQQARGTVGEQARRRVDI